MKKTTKSTQAPLPTDAELEILAQVWELGPCTVREVYEALSKTKSVGYTTILKQMQVMAEKGSLSRSERFRSHVYEAAHPREQVQQRLAGDLVRRAFGGSVKTLLMGVLSAQDTSAEELAEIRQMLKNAEKGTRQ